jgi:hypothetical protein
MGEDFSCQARRESATLLAVMAHFPNAAWREKDRTEHEGLGFTEH